jgi:hypothetical protein
MFNEIPDAKAFSVSRVIFGSLRGLLISLGCFVGAIFVGSTGRQSRIMPLLNAAALAVVGIVGLRSNDKSGLARGAVIAFALVFFINAICGGSFLGK